MDTLLDSSRPLDIGFFDQMVAAFYEGDMKFQQKIVEFQNHPDSWTRVDGILEKSQNPQSKMIALIILENVIKTRWKILPKNQKEGIKTFIVNLVIKLSSDPANLANQQTKVLLRKLNSVLIAIVKQDWPHNWPTFISDLVNSSKNSESLCANNMNILLLLSEEVFEYSSGEMTMEKMKIMKKSVNKEFTLIFQLCDYILEQSMDHALLTITLETLLRFLHWIPVGYIFETKLIETLALKFFPAAQFQNATLKCLTEIGSLSLKDQPGYNPQFVQLFCSVIGQVETLLTAETDIAEVFARGEPTACEFIRHLALFITGFLKAHLALMENGEPSSQRQLGIALNFLLRISRVADVVIFKICLEYWIHLVTDLYDTMKFSAPRTPLLVGLKQEQSPRLRMYNEILSNLRRVMISKMAKPEEVLIVEDENGQIVRELMKDTDSIVLYKNMRECLIYLTHLDPADAQETMLLKLSKQVDNSEHSEWSWNNLNTLCWAIGSISGALMEMQEKTFLVRVIKDLLGLCEMKKGKDHKAVIASNIMYVVGQYPRFLRQHWKFLKTVVNKLFEFMHEKHPGVQDMSCDTFLKIARTCRRKFVVTQEGIEENRPFVEEILDNLRETIGELEQSQIHTFYEAVATIIQSQSDPEKRDALVFRLMELPNQSWNRIVQHAKQDQSTLWVPDNVKQVVLVLKTNNRVASSLGHAYMVQLSRIYVEMLQMYQMYSQYVSMRIQENSSSARTPLIRSMRAVKKETLKLVQSFVETCQESDKEVVYNNFIPKLMEPVLADYQRNAPEARDCEVLTLFASITSKLQGAMVPHIPAIFESTMQCTLEMITKNMEDFPDHRIAFFKLLREINKEAFPALLALNAGQFQMVMDSILWALKHLERNIADTGLNILLELLKNVETSAVANDFFKGYFTTLLQDLLGVLTDAFHKTGFRLQSQILAKLFTIIDSSAITVPLWSAEQGNFPNNQEYIRGFVSNLIRTSFANLSNSQVEAFTMGLFQHNSVLFDFKNHLRDFLVQLKEFSTDGNNDLFLEEQQRQQAEQQANESQRVAQVPGLLYTGPSSGIVPTEEGIPLQPLQR